jgi:hypothetical protein
MINSNQVIHHGYLRDIPLDTILCHEGAKQDVHDKKKWHTIRGPLSINGSKFFNWHNKCGGGGAIDLVMHLKGLSFPQTITYLNSIGMFGKTIAHVTTAIHHPLKGHSIDKSKKLVLPAKKIDAIAPVAAYLIQVRKLPPHLVDTAIASGALYADAHANAVFLMKGKKRVIVGAELRGTTLQRWRGLAPGSNRQRGAFYTGSPASKNLILCESAIDALSYVSLYPGTCAISTAGANAHLDWIKSFINSGFRVTCAFDNDRTGNSMADKMITLYPEITRHMPLLHDWNDVLRSIK